MPRSPAARRCLRWRPLLSSATAYVLLIIGPVTNAQEFTGKPPIVCATADGFATFVAEAAQRFGIPATWIRVVMRAESFGEVRAISPEGDMGLMQIMPETWARVCVSATALAPIPMIGTTTSWPVLHIFESCTTAMVHPAFWPPAMPVQRAMRII